MPKRLSKPSDQTELAARIVSEATGSTPPKKPTKLRKNPAAVALGRLGGQKGGKARAEKLSAERRRDIARKAAEARWQRKQES